MEKLLKRKGESKGLGGGGHRSRAPSQEGAPPSAALSWGAEAGEGRREGFPGISGSLGSGSAG